MTTNHDCNEFQYKKEIQVKECRYCRDGNYVCSCVFTIIDTCKKCEDLEHITKSNGKIINFGKYKNQCFNVIDNIPYILWLINKTDYHFQIELKTYLKLKFLL